jgi:hypothetical protein
LALKQFSLREQVNPKRKEKNSMLIMKIVLGIAFVLAMKGVFGGEKKEKNDKK